MTQSVAILTGDLIGSTAAPPDRVEATMDRLALCAAAIGPESSFTRFRGDGWQMRLVEPGHCLKHSLYILASLRAENLLATRIAVGIGVEYPTGAKDLSTARGPAFTASGRALETMRPGETLALAGEGIDGFRQLAFAFAADHAARWSAEQAEAMAMALGPEDVTQESIAARLGITRQAVGARFKAAGYGLLDRASLAFLNDYTVEGGP